MLKGIRMTQKRRAHELIPPTKLVSIAAAAR